MELLAWIARSQPFAMVMSLMLGGWGDRVSSLASPPQTRHGTRNDLGRGLWMTDVLSMDGASAIYVRPFLCCNVQLQVPPDIAAARVYLMLISIIFRTRVRDTRNPTDPADNVGQLLLPGPRFRQCQHYATTLQIFSCDTSQCTTSASTQARRYHDNAVFA